MRLLPSALRGFTVIRDFHREPRRESRLTPKGALKLLRWSLHLDEQHAKRRFCGDAVRQHRRHIGKGAWLGIDLVRSQLDLGFSFDEVEDSRCRR